jgi:putative DNA primase/helicase
MADRNTEDLVTRAKAISIRELAESEGFWSKLKRKGREFEGPCPKCGGTNRFAVKVDDDKDQLWNCRGCADGNNDAISLAGFLWDLDYKDKVEFITICKRMISESTSPAQPPRQRTFRSTNGSGNGHDDDGDDGEPELKPESEPEIEEYVDTFVYLDESNVPQFEVRRFKRLKPDGSPILDKNGKPKKTFKQYHYADDGTPILGLGNARLVPYRLPELIAAIAAKKTILIPEGEAKVDLLRSMGFEATCGLMGSSGFSKFWEKHSAFFTSIDAVIMPDRDERGFNFANKVAALLSADGVAARVRFLKLGDLPAAGDIKDWFAKGHTSEELTQLVEAAPLWTPEVAPQGKPKKPVRTLEFECMDDVESKAVEWVWKDHFARGKLTLVAGDPGVGKSQIAMYAAAIITTGCDWPDGSTSPQGSVIILSSEDAANDTIKPRLEAAGADLKKVHRLKLTKTEDGQYDTFSLQTDLQKLGEKATAVGDVVMIVIDPLTSYMGSKIDSHRTTDVRAVLEPISNFAERFNVAIFAITHPPKATQSKAINSVTGSLAYVAASRIVFIAMKEPETTSGRHLLLSVKSNLGPSAKGLGYFLLQRIVSKDIVASYIEWDHKPVVTTADQALAALSAATSQYALNEAVEFLKVELANGPRPSKDVLKAADSTAVARKTLYRAKERLKVKSSKTGLMGGWEWSLPVTNSLTKDDGLPFKSDDD